MTVDGRPVTPRRRGVSESSPAWSPDGSAIAFARFRVTGDDYRSEIVVRELGPGVERVLVSVSLFPRFDFVGRLDWSPDGSTIAYTHSRIDAEHDIRPDVRTVPAAGGASRLLISDAQSPAAAASTPAAAIPASAPRGSIRRACHGCATASGWARTTAGGS